MHVFAKSSAFHLRACLRSIFFFFYYPFRPSHVRKPSTPPPPLLPVAPETLTCTVIIIIIITMGPRVNDSRPPLPTGRPRGKGAFASCSS